MQSISHYHSPLGTILLAADDIGLTGLWFEGQKYYALSLDANHEAREIPIFTTARHWLELYFQGQEPDFSVPLHLLGTDFQKDVWHILCNIPWGQTITYGEIARQLAARRGISHMSAQAVGGAVGRNPISILVPCHRVLGSKGTLTGYAGGLERKMALLQLEKSSGFQPL